MKNALFIAVGLISLPALAQVNQKGTFQIGFAPSIGAHATEFEYSITYPFIGRYTNKSTDAAATVSFPLDVHAGLSDRFSLGLVLEPGQYIDSAGTHPNTFFTFSVAPRFYLLNKDRAALLLQADLGAGMLRISEVESGTKKFDDTYAGGHFRLGAQFQYYFGKTFGLNFGVKYAAHTLQLRDRDPEDPLIDAVDYEARLRTSGVQFQLGAQIKL